MSKDFEEKTTKTLASHGKKFDVIDRKLKDHDAKFDRVFNKLLEHDLRFDQLETKLEKRISETEDRILGAIDRVLDNNNRVETEQVAVKGGMERMQDEIDSNTKDIIKIKKVVKIA